MLLGFTGWTVELFLEGGAATVEITSHYEDEYQEKIVPQTTLIKSNGTTPVVIVPAPAANTARRVQEITICNTDSASHNVSVDINNGAVTFRQLSVFVVAAGKTLQYIHERGWSLVS